MKHADKAHKPEIIAFVFVLQSLLVVELAVVFQDRIRSLSLVDPDLVQSDQEMLDVSLIDLILRPPLVQVDHNLFRGPRYLVQVDQLLDRPAKLYLVVVQKLVGLRSSDADEMQGLDFSIHGEHGYGMVNAG